MKRKTSNDWITLARLTICLKLPNTLAMKLSNFMMILKVMYPVMNYYVELELLLSLKNLCEFVLISATEIIEI